MPILRRLVSLYERRGVEIATGLSPWRHLNLPKLAFTWFLRDGRSLTNGLGISAQEVYFLECLFEGFRPASIFIIGNSWGWSTLALALLNPQARVVAIDSGFDGNALEGLAFTNRVATEEGLNVKVVQGTSPRDVPAILAAEFDGSVDFAFIDGFHTAEQVFIDFQAIQPAAAADAVYLFHDVLEFKLQPGLIRASEISGLPCSIIDSTSSGMAMLFDPAGQPAVADAIRPFQASAAAQRLFADEVYKTKYRRRLKWRRSFQKRWKRVQGIWQGA